MRGSLFVLIAVCAGCRRQPTPPVAPREHKRVHEPVAVPLTPDVALEMIEARYVGGMHRCYRAQLRRNPRAQGRVTVTFTVDRNGQLATRDAKGVGRSLEKCVERAMSRWWFPAPAAETTFRLAFRLSSRA